MRTDPTLSVVKLIAEPWDVGAGHEFLTAGQVEWLRPDGAAMTGGDWAEPAARALAMASSGDTFSAGGRRGLVRR